MDVLDEAGIIFGVAVEHPPAGWLPHPFAVHDGPPAGWRRADREGKFSLVHLCFDLFLQVMIHYRLYLFVSSCEFLCRK